jgi:cell fate (sporulation/competence/biofilm development) regulator YlbF (YheA/YmcA/DUF963 family)
MLSEDSAVIQRTRDLCQAIVDQPDYQAIRRRIMAFQTDDTALAQYNSLGEKQAALQRKQEEGVEPTDAEINDFERDREAFFRNPVAGGFIEAQQELHEVKKAITQLVSRTFELGRVPRPDECQTGSCCEDCCCH